jgi:hypothetical protein
MRSIRVSLLVGSLVGTLGLLFVVSAVLYRGAAAILSGSSTRAWRIVRAPSPRS